LWQNILKQLSKVKPESGFLMGFLSGFLKANYFQNNPAVFIIQFAKISGFRAQPRRGNDHPSG
jgi:hypothetical protein